MFSYIARQRNTNEMNGIAKLTKATATGLGEIKRDSSFE